MNSISINSETIQAVPKANSSSSLITQIHGHDDLDINIVKQFIRDQFYKKYQAEINNFMPNLVSILNHKGQLKAAVGYRNAKLGPLFLEQYLSSPIETLLSTKSGQAVSRDQIVEVGNLACVTAGYARIAIIKLTQLLHNANYQWVVFTLTQELLNSFKKLNLTPQFLEIADQERIISKDSWGTYYETSPVVMYGHIETGLNLLSQ